MIIENFRYYLESEEVRTAANGGIYLPFGNETMQTPLLLGRRFAYMGDRNNIFPSGGSGYTMNKAALKSLVVNGLPNYFPHMHTFSEGKFLARTFSLRLWFVCTALIVTYCYRYNGCETLPKVGSVSI